MVAARTLILLVRSGEHDRQRSDVAAGKAWERSSGGAGEVENQFDLGGNSGGLGLKEIRSFVDSSMEM
jgi:hypothetical protein